jgi:hypothetical protein
MSERVPDAALQRLRVQSRNAMTDSGNEAIVLAVLDELEELRRDADAMRAVREREMSLLSRIEERGGPVVWQVIVPGYESPAARFTDPAEAALAGEEMARG